MQLEPAHNLADIFREADEKIERVRWSMHLGYPRLL